MPLAHRASHALFAFALGCTARPLAEVPPVVELESAEAFPVETKRKIDLIFMVDNSISMEEEQASLTANFPRFMTELVRRGMPDLQIGIISSDFGAGGLNRDGCSALGDAGRFKVNAGCPLHAGGPPFLRVDGEGRRNFDGTLEEAFTCMARLGTRGCGYEHQLQSIRVALSAHNPAIADFLRPDAHLGIVIISDEDDCSADPDATIFNERRAGEDPNLRCATLGHTCGGQPVTAMPMTAPLGTCQAAPQPTGDPARRAALINVQTFVDHVKSLKGPTRKILVAGVFGYSADANQPYQVGPGMDGLRVQPICMVTGAGNPAPAIRLKAFVDAFSGKWHSICGADLSVAMEEIGKAVAMVDPDTCLARRPIDVDPTTPALDLDCVVIESGPNGTRTLPKCGPGSAAPCYSMNEDAMCSHSGVRLVVTQPGPVPEGTTHVARCRSYPNRDGGAGG